MIVALLCLPLGLPPARAAEPEAPPGPSAGISARGPHHVYIIGDLLVTEPWIELDPGTPGQAYAYFTIENRGGASDRLVAASSEQADAIVVDANGTAPGLGDGGLEIPPHKTVALQRDGVHFIFQGLHGGIGAGPVVPGVLTFERAGPLHLTFATQAADATPAAGAPPAEPEPAK